MKTGLFFGSFNPVHIGHLAIANYILQYSELRELWFVISPQNPFKEKKSLLKDYHRYELLYLAINDFEGFKISDVEFKMPRPSYTIDTLTYLAEKYPKRTFSLIMGSDNLTSFHKWKNYEQILKLYSIFVYPRPNYKGSRFDEHEKLKFINAPQIEISSSFIRKAVAQGKDIPFFMPAQAYEYMQEMNFYKY